MTGFCRPEIPTGHECLVRVGLSRSAEVGGPLPTGKTRPSISELRSPIRTRLSLGRPPPGTILGRGLCSAAANATVASQQEWGSRPRPVEALRASTGSGQVIALYIFGCAIVSIAA